MTHPLYHSRAGRLLYKELPEAFRLYDNRDPTVEPAKLGDLEAYLFGFGHLLDRFDATLLQLRADSVLDPVGPSGDEDVIQGWLLPYVSQLFGVELLAPDPDGRRRELSVSIWAARRRGTRAAVDVAAEHVIGQPVEVVPGAMRVLRTPSLAQRPPTHRSVTGLWHPDDARILQEPLPGPPAPATHVEGFGATRGGAHDGLPVGTPDAGRRMRAVRGGLERPDAEVRPESTTSDTLVAFVIRKRRGAPCFPDTYEDRSLRTPDMRAPRANRPAPTGMERPDAVTLFVRPPSGLFAGAELRVPAPEVAEGRLVGNGVPGGGAQTDVFYDDTDAVVVLNAANADPAGQHVIEGLRFAGTVRVMRGRDVRFVDCAIRRVTGPATAGGAGSSVEARGCAFEEIDLRRLTLAESIATLEYCTVTETAILPLTRVSDSVMAGSFEARGDGSGTQSGCVRYSAVPTGFDATHVHRFAVHEGPPRFLRWPCLERAGSVLPDALPRIGEPGFAVLSDRTAPEIARGAEDGGEMGVYHDAWHLGRLAAGIAKAGLSLPAGQSAYGHYDTRLLAPLPDVQD